MSLTTTTPTRSGRADRRWWALALLAMAEFVVVLDASIVNIALPSIGRGLNFSLANLSWVVNAYVLTFGGFLLLGGRIADLLGRRRVFAAGLGARSTSPRPALRPRPLAAPSRRQPMPPPSRPGQRRMEATPTNTPPSPPRSAPPCRTAQRDSRPGSPRKSSAWSSTLPDGSPAFDRELLLSTLDALQDHWHDRHIVVALLGPSAQPRRRPATR